MITEQTNRDAEAIADELRQRGDAQRAQAIDTIVDAVRTGNGANGASAAPEPVAEDTERVGDLFSVSVSYQKVGGAGILGPMSRGAVE